MNKIKQISINIFNSKIFLAYLLPSLLIPLFYIRNIFIMDDFWLHVSMGKYLIENNLDFPSIGVMNWFAEEKSIPWVAHEWLSEVAFYEFYQAIDGNIDIIMLFSAIICLFTVLIIAYLNKLWIEKNPSFSILYLLIICYIFSGFFRFRPYIFSFFFFWVTSYLLVQTNRDFDKYKNYLFIIPFLGILWSNFHGGSSVLVYIMPLLFLFSSFIPLKSFGIEHRFYKSNTSNEYRKRLLLISILSFLSLFINPYGFGMVAYPFTNMADTEMITSILEWFPFNFGDKSHIAVSIILFYVGFTFFLYREKIELTEFIMVFCMLIMTFKSIRFIMYFSLFSTCVIFPYLSSIGYDYFQNRKSTLGHNIKLTLLSIFIIIGFFVVSPIHQDNIAEQEKDLIQSIMQENPQRIFDFGESIDVCNHLMYYGIKSFIDGRADISSKWTYHDAKLLVNGIKQEEIINKYNFDYLLMDKDEYNSHIIEFYRNKEDKFKVVFEDEKFIFVKVY